MFQKVKMAGASFDSGTESLSWLNEVNIKMDLTGEHYDVLSRATSESYDLAVLSCLKDLMQEDPYQLTLNELYHVFTLVKVFSLGPDLTYNTSCLHVVSNPGGQPTVCGNSVKVKYNLGKSDVKYIPKGYKLPRVDLPKFENGQFIEGDYVTYVVKHPTMEQEYGLIEWFQTFKEISRARLFGFDSEDLSSPVDYQKHRVLLHLHLDKGGILTPVFSSPDFREAVLSKFTQLPIRLLKGLYKEVASLNNYGIVHREAEGRCSRCGSPVTFPVALGFGVSLETE